MVTEPVGSAGATGGAGSGGGLTQAGAGGAIGGCILGALGGPEGGTGCDTGYGIDGSVGWWGVGCSCMAPSMWRVPAVSTTVPESPPVALRLAVGSARRSHGRRAS